MIIYTDIFQSTLKIKCPTVKLFRILNLWSENSFSFFSFGSILRLNNFLSRHKISEQQINPKVLSVVSACHYNGNSKNSKNRLQTNVRPSGAIPTNPRLQAKARMRKPQGGGKVLVQIPGDARGDEIDTCIIRVIGAVRREKRLPNCWRRQRAP